MRSLNVLVIFVCSLTFSHAKVPDPRDVAAFLRWFVRGQEYECYVNFIDPRRSNAKLSIKDLKSGHTFTFDPEHNDLLRIFTLDVTGDDQDELISVWSHGVYQQVIVHMLHPGEMRPTIVFQAVFRMDVEFHFEPDSDRRTITVVSSAQVDSPPVRISYKWDSSYLKFVKTQSIGNCTACFHVVVRSLSGRIK